MPSNAFSFSPAELSYLRTSLFLTTPIRPDSRTPTQFRALKAETDILPLTNGSAHLSFTDGSEAIVGVKAELERTTTSRRDPQQYQDRKKDADSTRPPHGSSTWISLSIDLPTLRDDDPTIVFLSEMMREALVSDHALPDALVINHNWHWRLYIDVLLISPFGLSSYPLPLLSLTTHLALRSTRLPRLTSEGEEDPLVDDDWEASTFLYLREGRKRKGKERMEEEGGLSWPPITLLVMLVDANIIFDPSREELAVADTILAVSVGSGSKESPLRILAIRTIETPARDTMKGAPNSGEVGDGEETPGVWQPRVGGVKRTALKQVVHTIVGDNGNGGVAREVLDGLEGFLTAETGR